MFYFDYCFVLNFFLEDVGEFSQLFFFFFYFLILICDILRFLNDLFCSGLCLLNKECIIN